MPASDPAVSAHPLINLERMGDQHRAKYALPAHCVETHGMGGIPDVQEESIPLTRAAGISDCRVDGDVMALIGAGWHMLPTAVEALLDYRLHSPVALDRNH